jgi:hypothetical protein
MLLASAPEPASAAGNAFCTAQLIFDGHFLAPLVAPSRSPAPDRA